MVCKRRLLGVLVLGLVLGLCGLSGSPARGDLIATFEDLGLPPNSHVNDAGPSGYFESNGMRFNNDYAVDPLFGPVWSGWAVSSMTDSTTPGYLNQYSAITGGGAGGSATYGVAYTFGPMSDPFAPDGSYVDLPSGYDPVSMAITNTTYAYYSIKNGDAFTPAYRDGDVFVLTITGMDGAELKGSVEYYLADYRNGRRFILNTWETLDLSMLAGSSRLVFGLRSSVNDALFGMLTPAYFAADNLRIRTRSQVIPEPSSVCLLIGGLGVIGFWRFRPGRARPAPRV
jgi:hypothetical protein